MTFVLHAERGSNFQVDGGGLRWDIIMLSNIENAIQSFYTSACLVVIVIEMADKYAIV